MNPSQWNSEPGVGYRENSTPQGTRRPDRYLELLRPGHELERFPTGISSCETGAGAQKDHFLWRLPTPRLRGIGVWLTVSLSSNRSSRDVLT
jgi:hypothetical protein